MPRRNPELPEGTDHIVNGALETNGNSSGGSGSGFIGSGTMGDGTGGTAGTGGGGTIGSGTRTTGATVPVKQQLRESATSLRDQAADKARSYAEDGKVRATSALEDFSKVVTEAADSIDERLGEQYGQYARQAADAVSGVADTLREKDVDELYDNARDAVRKSPAVAIGLAAAVGFALVRLVKSGMEKPPNDTNSDTTGTSA